MSINKSTIITNIKDFLKDAKNESDMNKSNIIPKANYTNIISPKEIKKESDKKKTDNNSSSSGEYEDAIDKTIKEPQDETQKIEEEKKENEENNNKENKENLDDEDWGDNIYRDRDSIGNNN